MNNGRHRTTALYRFPRSIGPRYNGAAVYKSYFIVSVRSLLKLNKGNRNTFLELKSYFCKSLTEFYQISLKILPNLTDFSSQLMACMVQAS